MAPRPPRHFHNYAEDRQGPDQSEHSPAPYSTKWTEREWRVRPRDQEKDGGMIEQLQNAFRARLRPRVVKRGAEIQPQHCQSENDCADKKTVAAGIACSEE